MKHLIAVITSVCFAVTLAITAVPSVFADENQEDSKTLLINEEGEAAVGDNVSLTLYLAETTEPVMGFEMSVFYDNEFLEYQPSSLTFEKFEVVYFNELIPGKLKMNWTSINNLPEFSSKSVFLKADFKVLKPGNAEISYFITEMYGEDLQYLRSYKFTYDLSVNGKKVIENGILPVNNDPETLLNDQGDFINYEDGMGEYNTPNVNNHPAFYDKNAKANQNQNAEITNAVSGNDKKGGPSASLIVLFVAVPVIAAVIILAVVMMNKNNKKQKESEQIDE